MRLEELLTLVMAQSEEFAIILADPGGRILHWSYGAERVFGYSADAVRGKSLDVLFRPEDRAAGFPEHERDIALADRAAEDDRWMARADGSAFWASGSLFALRDAGGQPVALAKILRNRTNVKEQLETLRARVEALEAGARRKDEFLSTLSHELRGPLMPLATAAGIIRLNAPSNESTAQALKVIERQMQVLQRLVDDLLDSSRIEAGKMQLDLERLAIGSILAAALEDCAPIIRQKEHDAKLILPTRDILVNADRDRLHQVFVNLVTNAAKYTPHRGMIRVSATVEGREAVVTVEDNGIGIGPETLPAIFDLFTQAESARGLSQGGLGIGLALVKNLVTLHGGSVQVRSDGLGKGSQFHVRLPLA